MPINLDGYVSYLSVWVFIMLRVSSFFFAAPIFNQLVIPPYIRILLSITVSIILTPEISASSRMPDLYSAAAIMSGIQQVMIGIAMGLILQMTFEALTIAGQFVATSMSFNFAHTLNPMAHTQNNVLSNFYQITCLLIFISSNGILIFVNLIAKSFLLMPVSTAFLSLAQLEKIPMWGSEMFAASLSLAIPVMATILLFNMALAIMTRVAPSIHIFSVGFPAIIIVGLLTIIVSLPYVARRFDLVVKDSYEQIYFWQKAN